MKNFKAGEDAVSPVIGVVLMVGMTVIMISAVAVSVFAFSVPESAPHAKIVVVEARGDMDDSDGLHENKIVLKHKGGDALDENNTKIIITGKGCAYTGTMETSCFLGNMRATYSDLAGENYILEYDGEIVEGTSWDAGETITLYGSDGIHPFGNRHNNADCKWKIDAGSTVLVTIIDTVTNQVIATSRVTVKHP
ncbi:MAG: type IV pilin N-terminal domain-containing protein [Candidatus Methanoperedens sp.]|nr:type IV pilin N-terminal domain-containing protein [Candidatus Methanoperedens sp.]